MKAYWGSWGIVLLILDLGTRWRWVVSFTLPPHSVYEVYNRAHNNQGSSLTLEICIWKVPGLNLNRVTVFLNWVSSSFLSFSEDEWYLHIGYYHLVRNACIIVIFLPNSTLYNFIYITGEPIGSYGWRQLCMLYMSRDMTGKNLLFGGTVLQVNW
jgi:hypothetical protein